MSCSDSIDSYLSQFLCDFLPISLLKICFLVAVGYLLSRGPLLGRLLLYRTSLSDKLKVFLFFSALVVMEIWINPSRFSAPGNELLANRQHMSVGLVATIAAGILVGPSMGFAVGFVTLLASTAGIYWEDRSPHTPFLLYWLNSGIAACVGGLLGGWVMKFRPTQRQQHLAGFVVGALSQAIWNTFGWLQQTGLTPDDTLSLILPWIVALLSSGFGVLFFLWLIGDLKAQHERIGSEQVQRALRLANQTLPFLRQGLTIESAAPIAQIVHSMAEVGAVAITDRQSVLAHVGGGADHHRAGDPIPPFPIPDGAALHEVALQPVQIKCGHPDCPLANGIFNPLTHGNEIHGGVLLYGTHERIIPPEMTRLGVELAQFFSNYQVERAELEKQTEAASQAELKALQSQVHPHFLFNVLNTLAALCEIDPRQAGRLIVRLAVFLRRSLRESPAPLILLREEMVNVSSYLEIEQARFQDRLRVVLDVPEDALDAVVPSFGLQILMENAVLHGASAKSGASTVRLSVAPRSDRLWCAASDDGPGFPIHRRVEVFNGEGRASGLIVLRERGRRLLGKRFLLRIRSGSEGGTTVVMAVPQPSVVSDPAPCGEPVDEAGTDLLRHPAGASEPLPTAGHDGGEEDRIPAPKPGKRSQASTAGAAEYSRISSSEIDTHPGNRTRIRR